MTVILHNQFERLHLRRHIHLELCKISREIDSIFGKEMTLSIGCYFCWLTHFFYEILNIILINDYVKDRMLYSALVVIWSFYFLFKLLFINYVCEKICTKVLFYIQIQIYLFLIIINI